MTDAYQSRFEAAIHSPDPCSAFDDLAKALKIEGVGQVAMYHLFAEYQVKTSGNDPLNDAVLDTMDLIWGGGWAKGRALFDRELTSADVAAPDTAATAD